MVLKARSLMVVLTLLLSVLSTYAQDAVWSEDFSSLRPGSRWINRQETEVMKDGGVNNSQCVRVEYEIRKDPLGSTIRRSHMRVPPALEYTLQYDLFFESNWTNSYGGKFGGFGPEQGVAGCNAVQPHTWSARIVLRNREPRLYLYHQDKGPGCGQSVNSNMTLARQRWYSVSYYVKVNSRADRSDGVAELYIDGKLVASRRNLKFHAQNGDHTKISTIDFTTFLVRNSTGPIVSRQHMRYDNFAVIPGKAVRQSPGGGTTTPPPPEPSTYTLTTNVNGEGSVAKSPNESDYEPGTEVTLTATPATGMVFTGWSGDATGKANPLKVTMDQNRTVSALFTQSMPSGIEKLPIASAEASAEQNDDHLKELSYDGDPETRWANDNTPENNWIIYDLGESRMVNAVKLMLNVGETRTYPLKIEVGESKDNFTEVWSADLPPTIGLHTIVVTETSGRYVRVSMTGPNSDESNWFSIFQAEVWGADQGTSILSAANAPAPFATFNQIQGGFTVTAPGASAKLEVFDLKGKLLFQKSGVFENSFIPVRQNGVYFLRLSQGDTQINQRLVIQN